MAEPQAGPINRPERTPIEKYKKRTAGKRDYLFSARVFGGGRCFSSKTSEAKFERESAAALAKADDRNTPARPKRKSIRAGVSLTACGCRP